MTLQDAAEWRLANPPLGTMIDVDELEDAWRHRDDEPVDDDRLDELTELESWAQADDAWQPDDELVDETTAPDYDGAGTYADPDD